MIVVCLATTERSSPWWLFHIEGIFGTKIYRMTAIMIIFNRKSENKQDFCSRLLF